MVLIAIMMTVLVNIQSKGVNSYLLVIRASAEAERSIAQLVSGIRIQKLKSKTVNGSSVEMTYEVRVDKARRAAEPPEQRPRRDRCNAGILSGRSGINAQLKTISGCERAFNRAQYSIEAVYSAV